MNRPAQPQIQAPLRGGSVVAPNFIQTNDLIPLDFNQGSDMERSLAIGGKHMHNCEKSIVRSHGSFNLPLSIPRIFAIRPDEFFDGKPFVGVDPANPCFLVKICPHHLGLLLQHRIPILLNIHIPVLLSGSVLSDLTLFLIMIQNQIFPVCPGIKFLT